MKAQKTTPNLSLKVAIVGTGRPQRMIAMQVGIPEVRLSKLVRGCAVSTREERDALASALSVPVGDLFPEDVAVAS